MAIEIGYTDEVNACDCCGKNPLKYTVRIQDTDSGEAVHLGSVCAARYTGYRMTGNPWRAMERFASHAHAQGLTLDDILEGIEEHASAREG